MLIVALRIDIKKTALHIHYCRMCNSLDFILNYTHAYITSTIIYGTTGRIYLFHYSIVQIIFKLNIFIEYLYVRRNYCHLTTI